MPTHVFHPENNPPTPWDRLLVHPMENAVAALSILFGLTSAFALIVPGFVPSNAMADMSWPIVACVAIFLAGGGLMGVIGLHWQGDTVSDGWGLERFGWLLSFAGFLVYALTVAVAFPNSLFSWGTPLGLGLGCALRVWSVVRIERGTRKLIKEIRTP